MAVYNYTDYFEESYPQSNFAWRGRRRRNETLYRSICRGRAASYIGSEIAKNPFNINPAIKQIRQTTLPQFGGKVNPNQVRTVDLCLYGDGTPSVALETMRADSNGDFSCEGWYRPEPNGEYFFRVHGDGNYSVKDFPVQPPIENEYFHNFGSAADTATNIRVQYVEDNFNGVQGTGLNSHTPDLDDVGTGWAGSANNLIGQHADAAPNFVVYTLQVTPQISYIETNDADVVIEAFFVFGDAAVQSGEHGLILRYVDASNYLRLVIDNADAERIRMSLISTVATVDSTIQTWTAPTGSGPLVADKYYRLSACLYGSTIHYEFEHYVDLMTWRRRAQWTVKGVTDHQTATKHGLYIGGAQMYADRFKICSV